MKKLLLLLIFSLSCFATPEINEVVHEELTLSERYLSLENSLNKVPSQEALASKLAHIKLHLNELKEQIASTEDLSELKEKIQQERIEFHESLVPLSAALKQLNISYDKWNAAEVKWNEWRNTYASKLDNKQVKTLFSRAESTIRNAKDLISKKLSRFLDSQSQASADFKELFALEIEVQNKLDERPIYTSADTRPAMYNPKFWGSLVESSSLQNFEINLPAEMNYFQIAAILFSALVIFAYIYKMRSTFEKHKHLNPFSNRPFSTALLISIPLICALFPLKDPLQIQLFTALCWIVLARVATAFTSEKALPYTIALMQVVIHLFAPYVPTPLLRITLTLLGTLSILLIYRAQKRGLLRKFTSWGLYAIGAFLAFASGALFLGFVPLGVKIFKETLNSYGIILLAVLLVTLATGFIEYLIFDSSLRSKSIFRLHGRQVSKGFKSGAIVISSLVTFSLLLYVWGFYPTPQEALKGFFGYSFSLGEKSISISALLTAATVFYITYIGSGLVQTLLSDHVYPKSKIPSSAGISINRLVNYGILIVGTLFALSIVGFSMTNITIMGGAIGVGIGFGLQEFVKNFVSGIILLFERPIKVGDMLDVGGTRCSVKKIGLRATHVMNMDNAETIVPNWDLITKQVTNWSHRESKVKIRLALGVAYSTDIEKLMEVTLGCAKDNKDILDDPAPIIYFTEFGESSIDFQLIAWVNGYSDRFKSRNALFTEVIKRYRAEGIEIPYPVRNINITTPQ